MVETRPSSASNKRPLCPPSSPSSPPPNYFKRSKTAAATIEVSSTNATPVPLVEIISSVKESELVAFDLHATVVENPVLADLDKSQVVVEAEDEDEDSPQSLEKSKAAGVGSNRFKNWSIKTVKLNNLITLGTKNINFIIPGSIQGQGIGVSPRSEPR